MTNRKLSYILLSLKGLIRRKSFWLCLLLIPVFVFFINVKSAEDRGTLYIGLSYDDGNETAEKIAGRLVGKVDLIHFYRFGDEDPREAILSGRADAVWIFDADIDKGMRDFLSDPRKSEPFISVYEREGVISLLLSHELVYEAIYPAISRTLYYNFVKEHIAAKIGLSDGDIAATYDENSHPGSLVRVENVSGESSAEGRADYLTLPLKGLLSLTVLLCGLAGAMHYRSDVEEGKYDYLSVRKRLFPAYVTVLPAVFLCEAAVLITLIASGQVKNYGAEALSALVYVFSVTSVSVLFAVAVPSFKALSAIVPMFMLASTVISPIFFYFSSLAPLPQLLPTFYYLNSLSLYGFLYAVVLTVLTLIVDRVRAALA